MTAPPLDAEPDTDSSEEIGFGGTIAAGSRARLLTRSGSFNVRREGLGFWESHSAFHMLLTTTWPRFLALLSASYVVVNVLFAAAFLACGDDALSMPAPDARPDFAQAFFFSVHTFSTIGYGHMVPAGLTANLLVFVESLVGVLWLALGTGIVFARFARPLPRVRFSERAVIAPYQGGNALMFRLANLRASQLFDVRVRVLASFVEERGGEPHRRFDRLELELDQIIFFPLTWTVVHPLDSSSPLARFDADAAEARDLELLVLLSAIDEITEQTVHARSSYKWWELEWDARFRRLFAWDAQGQVTGMDVSRLDDTEEVGGRAASPG